MAEPLKKGRYFLAVGEHDSGSENGCIANPGFLAHAPTDKSDPKYNNFVEGSNKTFEALTRKGYQTRFAYGLDACHTEMLMTYHDLPNTLVWAWAEWKEKQGTDTTVRKKKQNKETAFIGKQSWPLVLQECTNGCCTPACTNCGKNAAGSYKGAGRRLRLSKVLAHDHNVDTEPFHFLQFSAKRVEF